MIITRFPPSPTGFFHIGSARTALFNYLFAASKSGEMVLRFEDTDKERSKPEFEKDILEGLKWLGIPYTLTEPYRQSERTDLYKDALHELMKQGAAYEAEEGKDGTGRRVIRFKNPNMVVTFEDQIRGTVTFDTTELKDFVIAKNTDEPLYHFGVVVDDRAMGITHVIRGEDHISNTPRQILILEALGYERPIYAHIPLILAPDRSKMSKRHGAVSLVEYRKDGFIPEALINYLALLGWNPGGDQEIYTLEELAQKFTLEHVHKGGAIFDIEKLKWFNHEHLKKLSDEAYRARLLEFVAVPENAPISLLKERARTLKEAAELLSGDEFYFLGERVEYDPALLTQKSGQGIEDAVSHLVAVRERLQAADFSEQGIETAILPYATEKGKGAVLWPLRVALSGRPKSPSPFVIAALLGQEKTLARLDQALTALKSI